MVGREFLGIFNWNCMSQDKVGASAVIKRGGGGEREKVRVFALNAKFMGSVSD